MWWTLTFLTELSHISTNTSALPIDTVAMTIAVRNLTFIMPKTAFLALPTWITLTFPIDIFPTLAAQDRTNTCKPSKVPPNWHKQNRQTTYNMHTLTPQCSAQVVKHIAQITYIALPAYQISSPVRYAGYMVISYKCDRDKILSALSEYINSPRMVHYDRPCYWSGHASPDDRALLNK